METFRANMQSGVIGFRRYRNTPYTASYRHYSSSGYVGLALRYNSTRWIQESFPVCFGSLHSSGIGVVDELVDINPLGGRLTAEGIYNRAVLLNLKNRAIAEARVKAANKSFDVAEAISGLDDTVLMILGPIMKALRAVMAARKGRFQEALVHLGIATPKNNMWVRDRAKHDRNHNISWPERMANFWLQFQYGWKPLLNDIYSGIQLVNNLLKGEEARFTVVRRIQTDLVVKPCSTNTTRFPTYEAEQSAQGSVEVRYRFKVSDSFASFLNGLGILNPAYAVWVGLPFSFVIDWILPVGTWLEALTGHIGLTFTSGYCTTRSWGVQSIAATSANPLYGLPKAGQTGRATARAERAYITREVFLAWPGFLPYIRFPFSSNERVASALALIRNSRWNR
jgi:hypothetical protein